MANPDIKLGPMPFSNSLVEYLNRSISPKFMITDWLFSLTDEEFLRFESASKSDGQYEKEDLTMVVWHAFRKELPDYEPAMSGELIVGLLKRLSLIIMIEIRRRQDGGKYSDGIAISDPRFKMMDSY